MDDDHLGDCSRWVHWLFAYNSIPNWWSINIDAWFLLNRTELFTTFYCLFFVSFCSQQFPCCFSLWTDCVDDSGIDCPWRRHNVNYLVLLRWVARRWIACLDVDSCYCLAFCIFPCFVCGIVRCRYWRGHRWLDVWSPILVCTAIFRVAHILQIHIFSYRCELRK